MTESRMPAHLTEAVKEMTGPAPKHDSSTVFDEAYTGLKSFGNCIEKTVADHPIACGTAAVAGAAIIFFATRGEGSAAAADIIKANLGKNGIEKVATQASERAQILREVGPIPDVARPSLDGVAHALPEQFAKAGADYGSALTKLKQLPLDHSVGASGEDLATLAKQSLDQRLPITGERPNADLFKEEEKRILHLNPQLESALSSGKTLDAGTNVTLYGEGDIAKLADKTQFKFVPQLGQFLKENGVTEEQISKALDIQKAQAPDQKKLLGQILTDEGLATKEQVDGAFGKQGALKKALAEVRKAEGF